MTIGGQRLISRDFLAELGRQPRYELPWYGYRDMYRRLIQTYQLWHEDRTSAANGIEARVPFLDHRLVELTYEVPLELQRDLFWDKTILREGYGCDHGSYCQRPKTPFFRRRRSQVHAPLLHNLLCADDHALIEEAVAKPTTRPTSSTQTPLASFQGIPDDPEFADVDMVLDLINMGLLAAMAKSTASPLERQADPSRR